MLKRLNYFETFLLLILVVLFNQGCTDGVCGTNKGKEMGAHRVVGGRCEYKAYRGIATITSITEAPEKPGSSGRSPYRGYVVRFSFVPDETIPESYVAVEGKEQTLRLKNSWNPGARFLEKYGIEKGKQFECSLKVITKGTCTPFFFEFPAIDLGDYFESRKIK